ncbi:YceD family protein [Evansella tamaricis]|uniref:DUF177 domain-containing protein n=1 Tax=Evansella tamaricis TaxID=2069301 RepID=A0ABS6JFG3_9BACI|nr:YceD family protein [Evansella tamaricis]MBU9712405.1 DUF177 domain-containing protein [Evansella tamaricis]
MKWSVPQLMVFKEKGLHIDEKVDVSGIKELDRECNIDSVRVTGDAYFSKEAITFRLTITGTMILPCARTLNDVEYPFSIDATEIFQLVDWATFQEDEEIHKVKENTVDLIPYIKERILLEKPMQVFCNKDDGPAPATGSGWELQTEEQESTNQIDPRLKDLEKFFDGK